VRVGHRTHDLATNRVRVVEHPDHSWRVVGGRLAHLDLGVCEIGHPGRYRRPLRPWHGERVAVGPVEAHCHVAGQLDVLVLVAAHRDDVGVVGEDVGCHQARVGEQAGSGTRSSALLLVLRHPRQLAHVCRALQQVRQLEVLAYVGLDEDARPVGVDARGQHQQDNLAGPGAQQRRVVLGRQGMQVGDEVVPRCGDEAA
jgi:hypothetical protein